MLRDYPAGSVLKVARANADAAEDYFVVLADGVQRIGEVTADLIRYTDSHVGGQIPTVAPDLIARFCRNERIAMMTHPGTPGSTLATDFELMVSVAGKTDARNEEIRVLLQSFIGKMSSVPPSVWDGAAAARFRDVVERWNAESLKLDAALQRIAETIRANERILREATDNHSQRIGSVAANL